MAGEIQIKRSSTAAAVPSTLAAGEIALNTVDEILYYKNNAGSIKGLPCGAMAGTKVANTIFSGPSSGAEATPAFRALVAADVPDLSGSYVDKTTAQTIAGVKTFSASVTAAAALARGTIFSPTLIAAANNDVLVGLDIKPTFTNGAFTGVTNYPFRIQNSGGTYIFSVRIDGVVTTSNEIRSGNLAMTTSGIRWGSINSQLQLGGVSGSGTTANSAGAEIDLVNISAPSNAGCILFKAGTASANNQTEVARLDASGRFGIGVTPTAKLHLAAGTATANTAPFKIASGVNLTTAEAGAIEYNGTNLFFTRIGTTRESVICANAVNTVSPTAPNRTITVVIDGTTFYLHAKTTND